MGCGTHLSSIYQSACKAQHHLLPFIGLCMSLCIFAPAPALTLALRPQVEDLLELRRLEPFIETGFPRVAHRAAYPSGMGITTPAQNDGWRWSLT